jgi:hypothetical protein
VENDSADDLDIKVAHVERATCSLTHYGKGLRHELLQRLAFAQALFKFIRLGLKLGVAQSLHFRLERTNLVDDGLHSFELTLIFGAEDLSYQPFDHKIIMSFLIYSGATLKSNALFFKKKTPAQWPGFHQHTHHVLQTSPSREIAQWIHRHAVDTHLVVQVRSRAASRVAHRGNDRTSSHPITLLDK